MEKIDILQEWVEQGRAISLCLNGTKILKNKEQRDRNNGKTACYDEILHWIKQIKTGNP